MDTYDGRLWFYRHLRIDGEIPPTENEWQRFHWSARARLKKVWADLLYASENRSAGQKIPKPKEGEFRRITIWRYSIGRPDDPNLMSPAGKLILDPMRLWVYRKIPATGKMAKLEGRLGWIYDDDPIHVNCSVISERAMTKKDVRTEVRIEWSIPPAKNPLKT